jgi:hypothetical protein
MKPKGRLAAWSLASLLALLPAMALAQDCVEYNGKAYVRVDATDASRDTGDEACAFYGAACVGATEPTDSVCKAFHPAAASINLSSGDDSGVYCDGPPQVGACSSLFDTCLTCSFCSASVACSTPIVSLYREMYFECNVPTCAPPDSDGDGIPDTEDACPDSDLRPTIIIEDDTDTGVNNELLEDGCTLSDLIALQLAQTDDVPTVAGVVGLLLEMRDQGLITGREMGALLRGINDP